MPKLTKKEKVNIFKQKYSYEESLQIKQNLEKELKISEQNINRISGESKNSMGLTPDNIKNTPEWKKAYDEVNQKFNNLKKFNEIFTSAYKKEIAYDRKKRQEEKQEFKL
jgi:hypothetical protein